MKLNEIKRMQQLAGIIVEADAFKDAKVLSPSKASWDAFLPEYNNVRVGAIIAWKVAKTSDDKEVQKKIWNAIDKPSLVQKVINAAQNGGNIYTDVNKEVEDAAAKVGS